MIAEKLCELELIRWRPSHYLLRCVLLLRRAPFTPFRATFYKKNSPPELITLFGQPLSTGSLNALILTCHRLHEILQPDLEARITPDLGKKLLYWEAASKPHIVAKLLASPHSINPNEGYGKTPLHVAAEAKNTEIVALLLDAGADTDTVWTEHEYRPLHFAVNNNDIPTTRLLLDHGADIDANYGCDGASRYALHDACWRGHLDMVSLLLERGANMELRGHYGTALGFAFIATRRDVRANRLDVIRLLLQKGAAAETSVPLNGGWLCGGPPGPYEANLLYLALGLAYPRRKHSSRSPSQDGRKERIAILLAHGASKDATMKTVLRYLIPLAEAEDKTEEELLGLVHARFEEAEAIVNTVGI
ncbi:Ankyrin repeat domain-containing protein 50 [Mycena venus]|uniref:Ankyrin repeat domain-containing protein 50 n=1 Tax=Mycena venus TaxID=2733690 RepID=A0A8H7D279_9AGAR|nr:Ankyrin repeat domain-containing protein 50 [Mycena venus]